MVALTTPYLPWERALGHQSARHPRELAAGEEFARGILNSVVEGVITIDQWGLMETCNPAAERMFGYVDEEIIGRNVDLLIGDKDAAQHERRRRAELSAREVVGRRKDGSTFPLELTVSEMSVGGHRLFVAAMRDISDRKNTEDELRQAYRMDAVGQITGGLVHDFNNLLGVVLGNLELACDGESAEARERLQAAIHATERGAALAQRLLAFSREKAPALVPVRLDEVVANIADLVERTLGETIDVRTETVNISDLMRSAESRLRSSRADMKRCSVERSKLLKISAITSCESIREVRARLLMNSVRRVCSMLSSTSFLTGSMVSMRMITSIAKSSGSALSTREA